VGYVFAVAEESSAHIDSRDLVKGIEQREKCLCILVNDAGIAPEKASLEGKSAEEVRKNLFDPTT
jgi:hypothetical protein